VLPSAEQSPLPSRKIQGLKWVEECNNPWPRGRLRPIQAAGLTYQHQVCQALGLIESRWFRFEDKNGIGYCSPDGLAKVGNRVLIGEIKLRQTDEALAQLQCLYIPVVEHFLKKEALPLVICRYLTREPWPGLVTGDLASALKSPHSAPSLLHLPWPEHKRA
jgi:hypothetical protein